MKVGTQEPRTGQKKYRALYMAAPASQTMMAFKLKPPRN